MVAMPENSRPIKVLSEKSYGVAVCLAGIFGVLGIHHFYLERWLHGLFDLSLSIIALILIYGASSLSLVLLGLALILIDVVHTVYVTYKLLVGEYKDGYGLIVAYPGQFK